MEEVSMEEAGRALAIGLPAAGKGIGGRLPAKSDMSITITGLLCVAGHVSV